MNACMALAAMTTMKSPTAKRPVGVSSRGPVSTVSSCRRRSRMARTTSTTQWITKAQT